LIRSGRSHLIRYFSELLKSLWTPHAEFLTCNGIPCTIDSSMARINRGYAQMPAAIAPRGQSIDASTPPCATTATDDPVAYPVSTLAILATPEGCGRGRQLRNRRTCTEWHQRSAA